MINQWTVDFMLVYCILSDKPTYPYLPRLAVLFGSELDAFENLTNVRVTWTIIIHIIVQLEHILSCSVPDRSCTSWDDNSTTGSILCFQKETLTHFMGT